MESFVIYNKNTGFIEGGSGWIDREWDIENEDNSTASKRISAILNKDEKLAVIYFPDKNLPDPTRHKIEGGKVVSLTVLDKDTIKTAKPKNAIELLESRVTVLEAQVAK